MNKLVRILQQLIEDNMYKYGKKINEETQVEKIILKATIGLYPEHTTGSEFDVLMKDGKKYSYISETSPFIHRKFFYSIKKGYLGKAMEIIKPYTKRVNNDKPE